MTTEFASKVERSTPVTGVVVEHVKDGSPADAAGIVRGHLIHEINRQPVTSVADFERISKTIRTGDLVVMLVGSQQSMFFVAVRKD